MSDPGWVIVEVAPDEPAQKGKLVNVPGYGVEVLFGGQFIHQLLFEAESQTFGDVREHWFDGKIVHAGRRFTRLWIDFAIDTQATSSVGALQRVVLRILRLPNVVWTQESGLGAMGSRQLLSAPLLHRPPGTGVLAVGASSSTLIHQSPGARYGLVTAGVPTGAIYPNRTVGNQRQTWFPTPGLYLDGYIAFSHPSAEVWIYAIEIDGNGAPGLFPLEKLTVPNNMTGGPATVITEHVLLFRSGGAFAAPPIPYPPNGCAIYVRNTHLSNPMQVQGVLAVRSA